MTSIDLSDQERLLIINMVHLFLTQNGLKSADEAIAIAVLMQDSKEEPTPQNKSKEG